MLFRLFLVVEKKTTFARCFQTETFSIVGFRLFLTNIRSVTGPSLRLKYRLFQYSWIMIEIAFLLRFSSTVVQMGDILDGDN